jgi:phosphohistidine phosphatase
VGVVTTANGRVLMLLRHAKSSWNDAKLGDHERPLDKRGHAAGRLLAAHFATLQPPALVLCSSALRTRQTLEHIRPAFATPPQILVEDGLYLASALALRNRIAEVPDAVESVLVIGHNPGLHELALVLGAGAPPRLTARLAGKFPTGALTSFRLAGPWGAILAAPIELVAYVTPADLAAAYEDSD